MSGWYGQRRTQACEGGSMHDGAMGVVMRQRSVRRRMPHPAQPFPATTLPGAQPVRFFFQAEDGIRDWSVTGVQTCALPISSPFGKGLVQWGAASTVFASSNVQEPSGE